MGPQVRLSPAHGSAEPLASSPASGRARRAASAALAAASLVVALGVAEAIVRLAHLAPAFQRLDLDAAASPYRRSPDPRLGFELRPSFVGDPSRDYPFYLNTNSHGQRDVERTEARRPGTRRVLLLGDSVVEGHGIRKLDDTMSRRLELALGDGTEVLNFGVSGYCTRAEVELLETKGLRFDPDAVVIVFTENDFNDFNRKEVELSWPRPRIAELLFARSDLFRLACLRLDLFGFASEAEPPEAVSTLGDDNVAEGLARLAELSRERGFDVLVAVWPRFLDDGVVDVHFMREDPGQLIVERLAAADGLPVFRLSDAFRGDAVARGPGVNPRLLYTVGDKLHPSEEGCRVAAAAIARALPRARRASTGEAPGADAAAIAEARETGDCQLHVNLGDALLDAGRVEEAATHYREALRLDPSQVEVRARLAELLQAHGQDDEATAQLRKMVEDNPRDPSVRFNLAVALERRGDVIGARALYEDALRLDPGYEMARLNLGVLCARTGDAAAAVGLFREAARRDPGSARAWNNLGLALAGVGRPDDAVIALEQALAIQPDYAEAGANLRLVRERMAAARANMLTRVGAERPTGDGP